MAWARGNSRTSSPAWKALRNEAKARLGYFCAVCGRGPEDGVNLDLDHIIPVAEGGTDTIENAQWLCEQHHAPKTKQEKERGIARRKARRRLPEKPHPGLKQ